MQIKEFEDTPYSLGIYQGHTYLLRADAIVALANMTEDQVESKIRTYDLFNSDYVMCNEEGSADYATEPVRKLYHELKGQNFRLKQLNSFVAVKNEDTKAIKLLGNDEI